MKARLIKNPENVLAILLEDGSYIESPDESQLGVLLFHFKTIDEFDLGRYARPGSWKEEYPAMASVPGITLAYITDTQQLVIDDVMPFVRIYESVQATVPIENVLTASEYAEKHNKSVEQIKVFCRKGRIIGAKKIGRDWVIPETSPYPVDGRFGTLR